MTFVEGEQALSAWMADNAYVNASQTGSFEAAVTRQLRAVRFRRSGALGHWPHDPHRANPALGAARAVNTAAASNDCAVRIHGEAVAGAGVKRASQP